MSDFDLRVVLVGWGAIGTRVATLLQARKSAVRIVGVGMRTAGHARGVPAGATVLTDPSGLAALSPDLVVEAAGRASVAVWGRASLALGCDFAVSSTSAFVDDQVLSDLLALGRERRARVIIPPGALGGIDALSAAARLPLRSVRHQIIKPPAAWVGTPAETLCNLHALTAPHTFFEGTARAAADAFPQNANVAVISALAGVGLDQTTVALVADPGATMNGHSIVAEGDFGRLSMALENQPLATNPKSSEMTALSLVRLIETRAGGLVI